MVEVFNKIVIGGSQTRQFQFHPRCGNIKISSIAFADDLFILAKAELDTIGYVKQCLKVFGDNSGLQPNLAKSAINLAGRNEKKRGNLCKFLGCRRESSL